MNRPSVMLPQHQPNYTNNPNTTSMNSSSASTLKQRQLSHLAFKLGELSSAVDSLDGQVQIASGQALKMRELGGYHASWFMAAARVMAAAEDEDEEEHGDDKSSQEKK